MTITIDLPEDTVVNLNEQAQAQGRPAAELVAKVIMGCFGTDHSAEEFPLDADVIDKIRRGFTDMVAGQTVSLEDSRTKIKALLAARHGDGIA